MGFLFADTPEFPAVPQDPTSLVPKPPAPPEKGIEQVFAPFGLQLAQLEARRSLTQRLGGLSFPNLNITGDFR